MKKRMAGKTPFLLTLGLLTLTLSAVCNRLNGPWDTKRPKETKGRISGSVKSGTSAVHRAYVFDGDTLLAVTDDGGHYLVPSIGEGDHELTCSAVNYADTTRRILIIGGQTAVCDFLMTPDSSTGKVYGEFQDLNVFNDSLKTNPALKEWDPKRIYDAATGATLQIKTYGYDLPDRRVFLGDSLVAFADAWGQYAFKIQCGTYPLRGSCEGYEDAVLTIKVLPDVRNYANFFLKRKNPVK
jgi:hypothetical protein